MVDNKITSFRGFNFASEILDFNSFKTKLGEVTIGEKFYFTISSKNNQKIFYVELTAGSVADTVIGKFFRDYSKYADKNMYPNATDFLIKGFCSETTADGDITDLPIDKVAGDVKKALEEYITIFLDSLQVIENMPY